MAENSSIEWCHHTFNPWWGCVRVSPGCVNCYAETFDRRVHGRGKEHWGVKSPRRFFGDKHWAEPFKWNARAAAAGERQRVFCASMADVFEDRAELEEHRARLFCLIQETPHLDWLLLTKRPELVMGMVPENWRDGFPPTIWMGTSVEDQRRANERIPALLWIPAAVRFLSCEPLLGPVDLLNADGDGLRAGLRGDLHWVIVGGESGPGARVCDLDHLERLVEQCQDAGVRVFVKQLGAKAWRMGDGFLRLNDPKGGDWSEWPEHLRVREFPQLQEVPR